MTALTEWEGEIEISLAVARVYPAGEWDVSEWDAAEWDDADTPLGDWLDVTCDTLVPIRLKAGASRTDGIVTRWEAATATVSLIGPDYDPRTGPWAGKLGTGLPVRIRWRPLVPPAAGRLDAFEADPDGWRIVFLGDVQNGGYGWDPAERTATLNCQDRTANLVAFDMLPTEPAIGGGEWASARIHRLCSLAYVPDDERDITSGGVTLLPSKLSGTAWANMLAVADTDIALLWTRRDGRLAFRPEGRVAENVPVAAVLVACPDDDQPAPTPAPAYNLLLPEWASAEAGTLSGWTAAAGAELTSSTAYADDGIRAIALTTNAAGPYAQTAGAFLSALPVTPGGTYTAMASVLPLAAGRTFYLGIVTWDAAGAATFSWGPVVPLPIVGDWNRLTRTFVAPANAVRIALVLSPRGLPTDRSEAAYLDRMGLFSGTVPSTDWAPPAAGFVPNLLTENQATIEDGTTTGWEPNLAPSAISSDDTSADEGTRSLQVRNNTAAAATVSAMTTVANRVPVSGTGTYTVMASVRTTTQRRLDLYVYYYDANDALLTTTVAATVLPADGTWQRLVAISRPPASSARWARVRIATRAATTVAPGDYFQVDRVGLFEGVATDWYSPAYAPPVPDEETAIGYVDLLDADPIILRNWVTLARRKLEGSGATEPAIVTRVDDASVARFRPQTYRNVALENADDAWTSTVADVVLADGAWPSTGPESVELDTRVHEQPAAIAAVLLDLEPEHVFSVESPIDRLTRWRMLAQGWDVEIRPEYVAGSVALEDVTGWGTAAGWDDPAPPHGWDVDTWALSGWTGGASGPGGLPVVRNYLFSPIPPFDTSPPGATVQIPLVDPGTGQAAHSFPVEAGTFSFVANVKVSAASPATSQAIRISISVNGAEIGSQTTTTAAETTIGLSVASYVLGSAANLVELNIRTPSMPVTVQTPTALTLTRSV